MAARQLRDTLKRDPNLGQSFTTEPPFRSSQPQASRIEELEQQIAKLKQRVASLQEQLEASKASVLNIELIAAGLLIFMGLAIVYLVRHHS